MRSKTLNLIVVHNLAGLLITTSVFLPIAARALGQEIPGPKLREIAAPEQAKAGRAANAREIEQQSALQQSQARSVVASASNQASMSTRDAANSEAVRQEAGRQAHLNLSAVSAATPSAIEEIKNSLPKLSQLGGQLKYGEHVVVSREGPEIISLIRSLVTSQTPSPEALRKIQEFASQGKAEAVHFLGFARENGLFGLERNTLQAIKHYERAASEKYQPAIYNLAVIAAYGKAGAPDAARARSLLRNAQGIANDTSGRVCGLSSFLAFRAGESSEALRFSQGCTSPLAHLARAAYEVSRPLPERVNWLRDSIATGVDDGYEAIARISRASAQTDRNFTFCKYTLVNKYYKKTRPASSLRAEATQCFDSVAKGMVSEKEVAAMRDQVVSGISTFVPAEIAALASMRASNRFHFSWSVPYLPFSQSESDLFEVSILKAVKK